MFHGTSTVARRWEPRVRSILTCALLVSSGVVVWWQLQANQELADSIPRIRAACVEAEGRLEEGVLVGRLAATRALLERAARLRALDPSRVSALESWIVEADALLAYLPEHQAAREALRAQALPWSEADQRADRRDWRVAIERVHASIANARKGLEWLGGRTDEQENVPPGHCGRRLELAETRLLAAQHRLRELTARPPERSTWRFAELEVARRHALLHELVSALEELAAPEWHRDSRGGVAWRLHEIGRLQQETLDSPAARAAWQRAIATVAAAPAHAGFELEPCFGLLPLGVDPVSGLLELAHLASGLPPERDEHGALQQTDDTGLVLVLVPGGSFTMGASTDGLAGNGDPLADRDEEPPHQVTLEPFLLSKYELTRGQWRRLTGEPRDSLAYVGEPGEGSRTAVQTWHGWQRYRDVLLAVGLELPTEAQWEYAARAGTRSPWWTGTDASSLAGADNLRGWEVDGSVGCAHTGRYLPNPWGFHDVHGNVDEWCLDSYVPYTEPARAGDGLRGVEANGWRIVRGGYHKLPARYCRVSMRWQREPAWEAGVRPAASVPRSR